MGDQKKVAVVTGATGAIGRAIARNIATQPGFEVVLLCRNEAKARQAVDQIRQATGNTEVRYELADLSIQASIAAFAERWQDPLHVLVNNAAVTPRRREETAEGIERQFATNVLGYFWMTQALAERLKESAPARVVNIASYWAGDLDLNDLEFKRRTYHNGEAYRQSKQANRMLTVTFSERLKPYNVSINACHPGDVNSRLSNALGFGGHESPDEGAATPVWLATHPIGVERTGKYFEHGRERTCPFGRDRAAVEALYERCSQYTEAGGE